MIDDAELLRRYALESSEEAFSELVRRHIGLVYYAALRQCGGDAYRAEDVAQQVFTSMARKAAALMRRPALAGWLYTSTRYAAARAVRSEVRRQAREREAHAMTTPAEGEGAAADWERLKPVVDEALHSLGGRDREAVLLRFFEGRTFAEVGAQFALTEDAARMRVDRALWKMRKALARRGVTSSAAALGAALEAHAAAAVPAGVAANLSAAMAGVAAGGSTAGAVVFLTMTKLKLSILLAVLAAGSAGLVLQHRENARLREDLRGVSRENTRLRVENDRLTRMAASAGGQAAMPAGLAGTTLGPSGAPKPRDTAGVPLAAGLMPVESLGNVGRGTPRATFATQLWAARTGNVGLEATTLLLEPAERAKLETLLPTLPESIRKQCGTPEELMAFALAGSPHPVGGMQVLGETAQGPDDVTLQTEWQHTDDSVVHQNDVEFHNESDGWKMIVPPTLVNRAVAYLGRR